MSQWSLALTALALCGLLLSTFAVLATAILVLNLYGNKVPRFLKFVQTLKPKCIDNLCPGDAMSGR